MKRYLLYAVLFLLIAVSCKKTDDDTFTKPAITRIDETNAAWDSTLRTAPYGWKAYVYTGYQGSYSGSTERRGFTFYFEFKNSNRVSMLSDFMRYTSSAWVTTMGSTINTASYRVRQGQLSVLSFDTYSYVSVLTDPDPTISGGSTGLGLISDNEYYLNDMVGDTITLIGVRNGMAGRGAKIVLIKATQQEQSGFKAGKLETSERQYLQYIASVPNRGIISPNGDTLNVQLLNARKKILLQSKLPGTDVISGSSAQAFSFTLQGMHLEVPINFDGVQFQDLIWDADSINYYYMAGGNKKYLVKLGQPFISLASVIGTNTSNSPNAIQINMSDVATMPATSLEFNKVMREFRDSMATGTKFAKLDFKSLIFAFDNTVSPKTMTVIVMSTYQTNTYYTYYNFNYTRTGTGENTIFRFTKAGNYLEDGKSEQSAAYFEIIAQRLLTNNGFTLKYYNHSGVLQGRLEERYPLDGGFTFVSSVLGIFQ